MQRTVLVVLSPGRSFSTVLSAMLGLHPHILALPETCLFARDTMERYLNDLGYGLFDAGLVHAVSRLYFGGLPNSRELARQWVRNRRGFTTRSVFEELGERADRPIVIEKTPILTTKLAHMRRVEAWFGDSAHYLHLVRHPHAFGLSLLETANAMLRNSTPETADHWFHDDESIFSLLKAPGIAGLDPERPWVARNRSIETFLEDVPQHRWTRVRGEDILSNPAAGLIHLCTWIGVPITAGILAGMLRPEQWEFATGRPGASGGDRKFFMDPELRLIDGSLESASSPVPWSAGGRTLTEDALSLARQYGYA
jgi:hypothetical protein